MHTENGNEPEPAAKKRCDHPDKPAGFRQCAQCEANSTGVPLERVLKARRAAFGPVKSG